MITPPFYALSLRFDIEQLERHNLSLKDVVEKVKIIIVEKGGRTFGQMFISVDSPIVLINGFQAVNDKYDWFEDCLYSAQLLRVNEMYDLKPLIQAFD